MIISPSLFIVFCILLVQLFLQPVTSVDNFFAETFGVLSGISSVDHRTWWFFTGQNAQGCSAWLAPTINNVSQDYITKNVTFTDYTSGGTLTVAPGSEVKVHIAGELAIFSNLTWYNDEEFSIDGSLSYFGEDITCTNNPKYFCYIYGEHQVLATDDYECDCRFSCNLNGIFSVRAY